MDYPKHNATSLALIAGTTPTTSPDQVRSKRSRPTLLNFKMKLSYVQLNTSTTRVRGLPNGESYFNFDSHDDKRLTKMSNTPPIDKTRLVKQRCTTNIRSRKVNLMWIQITQHLSPYSIEPIFYNVGEWNGLRKRIATSSVQINNDVILTACPKSMAENTTEA